MRIYFIYLTVFLFLSLSSFPLFFPFLQAKPLGHFSRQIPMQICIQFKSVLLSRIHHFPHPSATILPSSSLLHIGLQSIYACVHVALAWKQNMPVGFFRERKRRKKEDPNFSKIFSFFFLYSPSPSISLSPWCHIALLSSSSAQHFIQPATHFVRNLELAGFYPLVPFFPSIYLPDVYRQTAGLFDLCQ